MTTPAIFALPGTQIGPLDVVPLKWNLGRPHHYLVPPAFAQIRFSERCSDNGGPTVEWIEITNLSDDPFVIPAGWVIGAQLHQVRTIDLTNFLEPRERRLVSVSCVEEGRWCPGQTAVDAGRAPLTVIASGSVFDPAMSIWQINPGVRQQQVWRQVRIQEERSGQRPTHSLEQTMREDVRSELIPRIIRNLTEHALSPLPDQNGVLIAYEGDPILMEFFSLPSALKSTIKQTVQAISFDIEHLDHKPTRPSAIANFISSAGLQRLAKAGSDGSIQRLSGGSCEIDTQAIADDTGNLVHLLSINRNHRVFAGI